MVQFFQQGPSREAMQSSQLAQGLGSFLGSAGAQNIRQSQLKNALDEAVKSTEQPGASELEGLAGFIRALAGVPGSERYVGALAPLFMKKIQASQSGVGGTAADVEGGQQPIDRVAQNNPMLQQIRQAEANERQQSMQRMQLPEFGQSGENVNQIFPNISPGESRLDNTPQAATTGEKRRIYSPQEVNEQGRQLYERRNAANIRTTLKEAVAEIKELNRENAEYNAFVEQERQERVGNQQKIESISNEIVDKYISDASPKIKSVLAEKAEAEQKGRFSENEFKKILAQKAENFKNATKSVENSLDAPRWYHLHDQLSGKWRNSKQAADSFRAQLKPYLDLGLYDEADALLSKKGYGPEERDAIINPLDQKSENILGNLPTLKLIEANPKLPSRVSVRQINEREVSNLRNSIKDVLKSGNPSLLMVRKFAMDKNYDWKVINSVISDLANSQEVTLNPHQQNQLRAIGEPPLSLLGEVLHGLGISGR